ncbi:MAG: Coenzyme F420 hydrogenase/dehydrogenase, beta subunit C-terminal domain [Actinomycetota bacterium]
MTRRPILAPIRSITDVAERQLCTGCGACAAVQPDDIVMVDDIEFGRRPIVSTRDGVTTDRALACCPGVELEHGPDPTGVVDSLRNDWGPVVAVWEGYAGDEDIRYAGSSGGAATAIALYCIEREGMGGVLHTAARADVPYLNRTVYSTTREEMMAATGSRYAPASPCDRLDLVRDAAKPSVFIGKPCDVAATSKVRRLDERLNRKLGLTIGIFCAGTPTTRGTLEMLRAMGVDDPQQLVGLRYRGNGWPGHAVARFVDTRGEERESELTYAESWGDVLGPHRQWRCYVCADHTSEFADVAVGDPWYVQPDGRDPGRSLIVARSARGRRVVESAIAAGALHAWPVTPDHLPASQPELLRVRGAVWGRSLASRMLGIPAPRFRGMPLFVVWLRDLTLRDKLQSTIGLVRRVRRKGLWKRHPVVPFNPLAPGSGCGDVPTRSVEVAERCSTGAGGAADT